MNWLSRVSGPFRRIGGKDLLSDGNGVARDAVPTRVRKGVARNPSRATGLVLLAVLLSMALFAGVLAPYDPKALGEPFLRPCSEHLLGTDDLGRDVLSQIIHGARVSLMIGLAAAFLSVTIGVMVGMVAGYYRGAVEETLMGITDVFVLIPGFPLMVLLSSYMERDVTTTILVIGMLWWCPTARIVHSKVLQIRSMQYISSEVALGFGDAFILFKHVLSNAKDVIFTRYSLAVGSAMMAEASLSFLGLGDPYLVSWGEMLSMSFSRGGFVNNIWWWYLPPGFMIAIAILAFLLVGTPAKTEKAKEGFLW